MSGPEWIHLKHKETGALNAFPAGPGVREFYEARGWEVTAAPEDQPVPTSGDLPPGDAEWVQMVHSETGASHDFPNNPGAIAGAAGVGWRFPKPPEPAAEEPAKKPSKKATSATEPKEVTHG